jgi:hypothetical protein
MIVALALALLVAPAPLPRCAPATPRVAAGGAATNLAIAPRDRAGLRAAFLACHANAPAKVKGPLLRSVYYARHRGYDWAVATFSVPPAGTTDQPERFVRPTGTRRWSDLGDSGSPLAELGVPCPVLRAWRLPCR